MATPEQGSWGIEPVPERLRVLGTLDTGLLWGNLGVSLLVIVAGAALVPALSLRWGTGIGYFVPDAWLLALGVVLVLSRDLSDPGALPAAVVAGGFAAILALFALLVTETDEAFANTYSAAISLQNLLPRAPQALLVSLIAAIATAGALIIDFAGYQSFLLLLGSVFVPLFAVLLADWLVAGRSYAGRHLRRASVAPWPDRGMVSRVRFLPMAVSHGPLLVGRCRLRSESADLGWRLDRPQLRRLLRDRPRGRSRDAQA